MIACVRRAAMSATALAAITALDNKAHELRKKGKYTRALEKRREAVAAAQALGLEDCLITATLQVEEVDDLLYHMQSPALSSTEKCAALWGAAALLNAAVVPPLTRRKAAGTLLAGACLPVEVAWNAARLQHRFPGDFGGTVTQMQRYVTSAAPFIGYEAYMKAATHVLTCADCVSGLDTDGVKVQLLDFLTSATELMLLPRSDVRLFVERQMVSMLHASYEYVERTFAGYADELQSLWAAKARLLGSGVLQQRGIDLDAFIARRLALSDKSATVDAVLQTVPRRACELVTCAAFELHPPHFKKCAACKTVVYCCREHQVADWPSHKAACKAARKVAAQGGAA